MRRVRSRPPPARVTSAAPAIDKPDSATVERPFGSARGSWPPTGTEAGIEGFWLAIVKWFDRHDRTLEWFEAPEYPAFKSRPQDVALLHPEFRLSGK